MGAMSELATARDAAEGVEAAARLQYASREIGVLARHIRDLCGEDDQAFADTLDGESDVIRLASLTLQHRTELEHQAEAMKALGKTYTDRGRTLSERASRLKTVLENFMADIGERTLRLPDATLTLAAGRPTLVGNADADKLPDGLVRITREPNRDEITKRLKLGETVDGFSLSNGQPSLSVRRA